jgi:hypothetical protein
MTSFGSANNLNTLRDITLRATSTALAILQGEAACLEDERRASQSGTSVPHHFNILPSLCLLPSLCIPPFLRIPPSQYIPHLAARTWRLIITRIPRLIPRRPPTAFSRNADLRTTPASEFLPCVARWLSLRLPKLFINLLLLPRHQRLQLGRSVRSLPLIAAMGVRFLEHLLPLRVVKSSFPLGDADLTLHHDHPGSRLSILELLESSVPRGMLRRF